MNLKIKKMINVNIYKNKIKKCRNFRSNYKEYHMRNTHQNNQINKKKG